MELWVSDLGLIEHGAAYAVQESVRQRRIAGEIGDTLLLLEHRPVYTRGRRRDAGELPMGEEFYRRQGIDIVDVDRGGRVTYHGPGQLVGYPIMRTGDVLDFVRRMEGAIVSALADEGIEARQRTAEGPDYTGVWVQDRKIASIGVHVHKGVTTHGFAVNVDNDMQPWEWIVACGLPDVRMTSILLENGAADLPRFRDLVTARFAEAHGLTPQLVEFSAFMATTPGAANRAR